MKPKFAILLSLVLSHLCADDKGDSNKAKYLEGHHSIVIAISEGFFPKPTHIIWDDGVFLMWPHPEKNESFAFVGRYSLEDLEETLVEIGETEFHTMDSILYTVPDAGWTEIFARTSSLEFKISWYEYLHPGFGYNLTDNKKFRKFVKNWNVVRSATGRLTPTEIFLLMNRPEFEALDSFRGVDLQSPAKSDLPEINGPNKARRSSPDRSESK